MGGRGQYSPGSAQRPVEGYRTTDDKLFPIEKKHTMTSRATLIVTSIEGVCSMELRTESQLALK